MQVLSGLQISSKRTKSPIRGAFWLNKMVIMVGLDPDQYLHALDQKDRSGIPGEEPQVRTIFWFIGGAGNSFSVAVDPEQERQ